MAAVAGAMIGFLLPRFSAYFLGPLLLLVGVLAALALARANLHTEGSPAGLVIGGILILGAAIGGGGGIALTAVGALCIRARRTDTAQTEP
jgi:hypothetical protein